MFFLLFRKSKRVIKGGDTIINNLVFSQPGAKMTPPPIIFNLSFGGGGGLFSIQLFKELFLQPKLDIFRGV